ncbi:MAG: CpaF family protein [Candidatus Wallbacteria bacterium]|nr:CpaF family protein [Candidatus Wallbacteria bacterium]
MEDVSAPDDRTRERILRFKKDFHQRILDQIDRRQSLNKYELKAQVESITEKIFAREELPPFLGVTKEQFKKETFDNVLGYGPLEDLLNDPTVDDIMVVGCNKVFAEKDGKLQLTNRCFLDEQHLRTVIDRMLRVIGKAVNDLNPYADGRLEDGSRINVVVPPLALDGPMITIRKFPSNPHTMEDLIHKFGSVTQGLADFLRIAVRNRKNILVSGGSGTGKTTLLNALGNYIPHDERIVTIEDTAELKLGQPHVARMETRQPNFEGKGVVSIRDLVRNALRMRPDRIIVGECRGGEAIDMLQAMNTGHDGSLTTVHANSPEDVLLRLETMCTMAGLDIPLASIRKQIAAAVDLIVQVGRFGDGTRRVIAVTEILESKADSYALQDLFLFQRELVREDGGIEGELKPTGKVPKSFESFVQEERDQLKEIFSSNKKVKAASAKVAAEKDASYKKAEASAETARPKKDVDKEAAKK